MGRQPAIPLDINDWQYREVTTFQQMYDFFLAAITDDMYMELTEEDTKEILEELLLAALPNFEFPKDKNLFEINMVNKTFPCKLSLEEKKIIRSYMIAEWLGQQLANVDLVRQKYSGTDFKFTSQASHMEKLRNLKEKYEQEGWHLQRLYSRRKLDKDGTFKSTYDVLASSPKVYTRRG